MKKNGFSLKYKAFLAVLVILLPIFVTFMVTYRVNRDHLKTLELDNLTALSEAIEGQVFQFFEMSKRRAEDFSSDGFIRDSLEGIINGKEENIPALTKHLFKNKLPLDDTIHHISILTLDGKVVASTHSEQIGMEASDELYFKKGLKGAAISEPLLIKDGAAELAISAPLMSRDGIRQLGVLVNYLSFGEVNKVLSGEFQMELGALSWGRGRRKTMESYLVNSTRLMITDSRFIEGAAGRQVVDTVPVRSCFVDGHEFTGFYYDYRDVYVAGSAMCLRELNWVLLVEIDASDVLAPLGKIKAGTIASGLIVTGLIGLLFIAFLRGIVRNLQRISSAADIVAGGDYNIKLSEGGSDEMGVLSRSFNRMAEDIQLRDSELQESRRAMTTLVGNLPGMAYRCLNDNKWTMEFVSEGALELTGYIPADIIGNAIVAYNDIVHPDDRDRVWDEVQGALKERDSFEFTYRIKTKDGREKWVWERGRGVFLSGGELEAIEGFVADITEHKLAEFQLKRLNFVIDNSIDVVFITDLNGVIEYVNPMFETVTGYSKDEAIGQTPRILASGNTTVEFYEDMWSMITSGHTWRGVFQNKKKSGEYYWGNGSIFPVRDDNGVITNFLAVQEDVTDKIRSEEEIERLATYDSLTGLLNRKSFVETLDKWIEQDGSAQKTGAILMMDLDQFKLLNDTYGHGLGDELLRHFAKLFEVSLKNSENAALKAVADDLIIGRTAGDEFSVFISQVGREDATEVAGLVRRVVDEFRFMDTDVQITCSIGVVLYPEQAVGVKDLFAKVDAAVYRAKELGGNRVHLFSDEDKVLENLHTSLHWKGRILKALAENRFEPWYQPIYDIKEKKIHHYEALVRMRSQDGNIIIPGAFIGVAESFGLITAIDKVVTEKTMRKQVELSRQGRAMTFCVNLSGKDMGDEDFLAFLRRKIDEIGVDPKYIVFEITETAAINDMSQAAAFIKELRSIGCRFSLDDFGSGLSSFQYLKELNVDYIKIDGAFVKKIVDDKNDRLFVKAIADIAKGMGIKTIAEFVESAEILEVLEELNVDYAQGYHLGKPEPVLLVD
jgi:diguanylate cyclase (GGDEF)-like protein/PAS domain S-box-containing protein